MPVVRKSAYDINACIPDLSCNPRLATTAVNRGLGEEDVCALIKVFDAPSC